MDQKPEHGSAPHLRRRDVAKTLVHPKTLRDGLKVTPQPNLHVSLLAGVQSGLAAAIALPLVHFSPFADLIGFAALGTLVALFGRFAPPRRRNVVLFFALATQVMTVFLLSLLSWINPPVPLILAALALACGVLFFITVTGKFGPPGALVFVFAGGAALSPVQSLDRVFERTAAVLIVGLFAWLVCVLTEFLRQEKQKPFPVETVRPLKNRQKASLGITLGAGIAVLVAKLAGADFPSWAPLGTLAVMSGAHLHISMHKAVQRLIGTIIGGLFAWAVLNFNPDILLLIALIVALQIATETLIGFNYALGQIFVTPMALLTTHIASPGTAGSSMATERIIDTFIGAAVGIVLSVILSSVSDRAYLARYSAGSPPKHGQ